MLLHEKLAPYRLILASSSPRRRQLMADAELRFETAEKYECEETYPSDTAAEDVAAYLSVLKSRAYPKPLAANEILVTTDTTVVVGNEVLGKPADRGDAVAMLRRLSGCGHIVITGVTVRSAVAERTFKASTTVRFRTLRDEEIAYYVDTFRPYDKAGAYGIQEWIGYAAVEGIEGSFYNVMGLPVQRLYMELDDFIGR